MSLHRSQDTDEDGMTQLFHKAEVRKTLAQIIERGTVFEVRALEAKLSGSYRSGPVAGYFDNVDRCVAELAKLTSAKGIYATLNPVNPALLARCANRLDYAEKSNTTADHHIQRRCWLLLDVDADRPSGISASEAEKHAAKKKARAIYGYLKARGWPLPLVADSGNGFHLLYRVDLPCADDGLLENVLTAIRDRFDGDGVKLDRSVHNPARIVRLYGTLAAKGDNTNERPHRFSKILRAPRTWEVVSTEQLRALVDELRPEEPAQVELPSARNGAFDVEGFLTRYGVEVSERTVQPDGTIKWQLAHCPFNHDHVNGEAAVFQYPDGKLGFHCFHSSCSGNHWKDFRRHFEPERRALSPRVEAEAEPVEPPPAPEPYVSPALTLLPSQLQDYVHAAAETINVDVSFILLPLLSSLGSAIGNSRSIQLKRGFIQPPIIWTGIIARSGGRKSPALDAGCFAVMEQERELARQNKQAIEMYAEEILEWGSEPKKKERGPKPEPPQSLTCLMDDLTLAALADALEMNPRGVLVKKDELSHWFAAMDQFHDAKGADVSRWLSLHTGVFFGFDRKTDRRRFRLYQPRVGITGGIQPGVLTRVLTQDFFERGLPARFLFAAPPARKDRWSEEVIAEDVRQGVTELFEKLYELQPKREENGEVRPKLLRLDGDAKAEYVRYYNECGDAAVEGDERQEAAWSKLSGYAARLALVGQLARDPLVEIVSGTVMQTACGLARWFGYEAARIYASFAETADQRDQRKLVEFIESRDGGATVRDAITFYRPLRNQSKKAEQEFDKLVKAGRGKWEDVRPPGRGRRTRIFRLLQMSASAKIPELRGKTPNCADADTPNSQKKGAEEEPDIDAVSVAVDAFVPAGALMRI